MNSAKTTTTARSITMTRRGFSLAALVLGMSIVPSVDAAKKGRTTIESINKRFSTSKDLCETLGSGILTSEKVGKATVTPVAPVAPLMGSGVSTRKRHKCHQTQTAPSGDPPADPPAGEPSTDEPFLL